jgi:hypothetical protein
VSLLYSYVHAREFFHFSLHHYPHQPTIWNNLAVLYESVAADPHAATLLSTTTSSFNHIPGLTLNEQAAYCYAKARMYESSSSHSATCIDTHNMQPAIYNLRLNLAQHLLRCAKTETNPIRKEQLYITSVHMLQVSQST